MVAESLLMLTVALGVTRDADIRISDIAWLLYTGRKAEREREMQGSCEARHTWCWHRRCQNIPAAAPATARRRAHQL